MAFLQFVSSFRKKCINDYKWNKVVEVKPDDYVCHEIMDREECLVLYALPETNFYEIVVQKDVYNRSQQTAFSVCRLKCNQESQTVFKRLKDKLPPLYLTSPNVVNTDILQDVFDYIQEHPEQHLIHVAAHFGFNECIKSLIAEDPNLVNSVEEKANKTPLHFATKKARLSTVQLLMSLKPNLELVDKEGNNVLHLAAVTNKEIIQCICNGILQSPIEENPMYRNPLIVRLINARTSNGFTPLHLACAEDKPDCVKELLRNGADVNGASITEKISVETSTDSFNKQVIDQLENKDMKNGGTPLHWSRSPQCLEPLLEIGCDINAKNFQGETVLHVMVYKKRLPCIVTLLSYGADVNALGPNGNTPLHLAVSGGDVTIVQALVVFGANVNCENSSGETPRHIAATSKKSSTQEMILYILSTVGANRCKNTPSKSACNDGCAANCCFNGTPIDVSPFNRIENICDSLLNSLIVENAVSKKQKYFTNGDIMEIDGNESRNIRMLCLDGGGIRGLILIQMLSVLEEIVRMKVGDCFDWIAGTSTGGILALYIALGNSASECRKLYFRLKDKVFLGSRPYDSEPLEKFLREALGEETKMADIQKPRVMVTATVADQFPADMHVFRNYDSPESLLPEYKKPKILGKSLPKASDQLVWMAARSSGAAPTYFRPCGSFLDGGLISNNPTLDAITEIVKYNAALEAIGRADEKFNLTAVVSLGTGSIPVTQVPIIDIFRPDSLFGVAKMAFMASSLGQLLIDQASQADGQVVERAKAWCHSLKVPFFRLNPPISENIALDEVNNIKLINMLWETTAYMHIRSEELQKLKLLLI